MSKNSDEDTTAVLLHERRIFPPDPTIRATTRIKDWDAELRAGEDLETYWAEKARAFTWFHRWTTVLDTSDAPFCRWFVDGTTNLAYNAVDRHLTTRPDHVALRYVNEQGAERAVTYAELAHEVNRMANALIALGIRKGDRVAMYLPPCIEAIVCMLACAKIGAVHGVVFAGFSTRALVERIRDADAKLLITADGTFRRGKTIDLLSVATEAARESPSVEATVVIAHVHGATEGHVDQNVVYYHDLIAQADARCEPEVMDAEDVLFILYTSGSTGKPKGVVHTTGGYMVAVATTLQNVFDINDRDVWWCTADLGWITGHSYSVYAPLLLGTTSVIYEGSPDYPQPDALWRVVERDKVTKFYTAPTTIRHLMRFGETWPQRCDLSSLKILGTVGEPINPEAWVWYYEHIGRLRCPIMDTWWQTETGCFMISPLPISPLKPGSATKPLPGIVAEVMDLEGRHVPPGRGGLLVITRPWPSMLRTLYNNPERYKKTYWEQIPGGVYVSGDIARMDEDGYFWIQGRADDVLKIAGHRIGSSEIESAFVSHHAVSEAAVIGKPDPVKGEVVKAFVILRGGYEGTPELTEALKKHVRRELGPIAVIGEIVYTATLPKTRSGKIMRRVLKARELGVDVGDVSTLIET
ncbi:MAG: acetate--CoA ligase [Halobacteriota archaeon]